MFQLLDYDGSVYSGAFVCQLDTFESWIGAKDHVRHT